ncbi:hypothetical protein [Methanopyrus sp. SNP6]|uniref:hypothetical protein n=1 Tax=Methanopyrus sp. SNP6 TaxID=1937005 RepID=UPI0011E5DB6F|nr:hypothetical protein [Methanopyrus sp. SNP6]
MLKLARIAARHLRTALGISREACAVRRLIVRTQALAFDLEPACSTGLRGQLERAQRFVKTVLGLWKVWKTVNSYL